MCGAEPEMAPREQRTQLGHKCCSVGPMAAQDEKDHQSDSTSSRGEKMNRTNGNRIKSDERNVCTKTTSVNLIRRVVIVH